jgi:hypothetical protein
VAPDETPATRGAGTPARTNATIAVHRLVTTRVDSDTWQMSEKISAPEG